MKLLIFVIRSQLSLMSLPIGLLAIAYFTQYRYLLYENVPIVIGLVLMFLYSLTIMIVSISKLGKLRNKQKEIALLGEKVDKKELMKNNNDGWTMFLLTLVEYAVLIFVSYLIMKELAGSYFGKINRLMGLI